MNLSLSLHPRNSPTELSQSLAQGPYSASRVPASVQILNVCMMPVDSRASPLAALQWILVSGCGGSTGWTASLEVPPASSVWGRSTEGYGGMSPSTKKTVMNSLRCAKGQIGVVRERQINGKLRQWCAWYIADSKGTCAAAAPAMRSSSLAVPFPRMEE